MKGIKINIDITWNEKVSSGLCFILICLLSLITAWYTIKTGRNIIENPPQAIVKNIME